MKGLDSKSRDLAGAAGFEPANAGTKSQQESEFQPFSVRKDDFIHTAVSIISRDVRKIILVTGPADLNLAVHCPLF